MFSRRKFIQNTTLGIAGTALAPLAAKTAQLPLSVAAGETALPVGIAGFTFAKFDLDASIAMMKRLDVHYFSIKDFHLPLNSDAAKIAAVMSKLEAASIKPYAVGVIYMKTRQAVDDAFAYAKRAGVSLMVGVPEYDLMDYAEQQVKAFDIRLAIHNHGPEDKLYPGPREVYDRIKNRDARMGLCLDIGHAERAGTQLEQAIREYGPRIFDMHIKDVTAASKDGKAVEIGRGVIDFPALVKALRKSKYSGICSIEFEKDMTDPLPGIAESIGFFRGVMREA